MVPILPRCSSRIWCEGETQKWPIWLVERGQKTGSKQVPESVSGCACHPWTGGKPFPCELLRESGVVTRPMSFHKAAFALKKKRGPHQWKAIADRAQRFRQGKVCLSECPGPARSTAVSLALLYLLVGGMTRVFLSFRARRSRDGLLDSCTCRCAGPPVPLTRDEPLPYPERSAFTLTKRTCWALRF